MAKIHPSGSSVVPDVDLRAALDRVLPTHVNERLEIDSISRRGIVTASSYPLEALDVALSDGRSLPIVFKDLSPDSLSATARQAKPSFLMDPMREIETYERYLNPNWDGTATYFGSIADLCARRYWLFLERVDGEEMYQIGDLGVWRQVASWLARLHHHFASQLQFVMSGRHLLRVDRESLWIWPQRALRNLQSQPAPTGVIRDISRIAARYDQVVSRITWLPATLLHGEFYASNVLVQRSGSGLRICPIDWEMSAIGPPLLDLAACVAGGWNERDRLSLIEAYHSALPECSTMKLPFSQVVELLDACRLHLAIQWLGWSANWSPPPEQAHDWLGEAIDLAAKLRI